MPWNISSERSVYLQLMEIIKQKIMSGEYQPGQKLESVRELAMNAAVNPNTMQKALAELEREGFLYTQRTSGRYVTEDNRMIQSVRRLGAKEKAKIFFESLLQSGFLGEEIVELIKQVNEEQGGKDEQQ